MHLECLAAGRQVFLALRSRAAITHCGGGGPLLASELDDLSVRLASEAAGAQRVKLQQTDRRNAAAAAELGWG